MLLLIWKVKDCPYWPFFHFDHKELSSYEFERRNESMKYSMSAIRLSCFYLLFVINRHSKSFLPRLVLYVEFHCIMEYLTLRCMNYFFIVFGDMTYRICYQRLPTHRRVTRVCIYIYIYIYRSKQRKMNFCQFTLVVIYKRIFQEKKLRIRSLNDSFHNLFFKK